MDRSVALLCLIGLDRSRVIFLSLARYRIFRSRVISGYSRDMRIIYTSTPELLNGYRMHGNLRPDGRGVVPSVSVKDRAVVGPADHV